MAHERLIAARQVLPGLRVQIAEGRRQAVAAVLFGYAAKRPQRILQALRQSCETLPAKDDMGMLETGEDHSEVIDKMLERCAGDGHAGRFHAGEIRQPETAGLVALAEDYVFVGAVQRPPGADAPLQRAPDTGVDLGMPAADLQKNGDRPQTGRGLQHRHDLAVPDRSKRIGTAAATRA